jgi:hypothetical protein
MQLLARIIRSISPRRARRLRGLGVVALLAAAFVLSTAPALAQTAADSTISLIWTAPGDDGTIGRATTYDLRYRTVGITGTDTLSWWNAATRATGLPTPSASGALDSTKVRGLTPLTTYYFIIRAADEVPNWSGYSNLAVKSTTGDATPPAAIADLSITATTGNSLALRWTAPGNNGTTGTAASYDIRYSTSPITAGNWTSATPATGEPAPAVAGTVQTFTLPGLNGSQTYYVAMKTSDSAGNISGLSNVVNGTTLDVIPPAPVHDLSLESGPDFVLPTLALLEDPAAERAHVG